MPVDDEVTLLEPVDDLHDVERRDRWRVLCVCMIMSPLIDGMG